MRPFPRIDEPWLVRRAPAEVFHPRHVGRVFIKLPHAVYGEALEGFAVAAAVGEEVEEGEHGGHAGASDGGEEVVGEGRAAVWRRDGGYGEDVEFAVREVRR